MFVMVWALAAPNGTRPTAAPRASLPGQSGVRFSLNAATPSARSPENATERQAASSTSRPARRSRPWPSRSARLAARRPTGELAAIRPASASASVAGRPVGQHVDEAELARLRGLRPGAR